MGGMMNSKKRTTGLLNIKNFQRNSTVLVPMGKLYTFVVRDVFPLYPSNGPNDV